VPRGLLLCLRAGGLPDRVASALWLTAGVVEAELPVARELTDEGHHRGDVQNLRAGRIGLK